MITDDDLLLYYYRDGLEPAERSRIGAALTEQPELAQRYHRLVSRLDAAAAIPEVEVPLQAQQRCEVRWTRRRASRRTRRRPRAAASRAAPAGSPRRPPYWWR